MATSGNYSIGQKNPFLDDDEDVDDAAFLAGASQRANTSSLQERREQLLAQKRQIEERTLKSSARSVGLLQESEEIGVATAEELQRQRESLQNSERRLDGINDSLRISQKHIQGIKSVFGSLKNYFSGGVKPTTRSNGGGNIATSDSEDSAAGPPKSRSNLSQILENHGTERDPSDHPSVQLRSDSLPDNVDQALDRNLQDMSVLLGRLKMQGQGLQEEIDSQNDLIGRITDKATRADDRIKSQNREITKILRK